MMSSQAVRTISRSRKASAASIEADGRSACTICLHALLTQRPPAPPRRRETVPCWFALLKALSCGGVTGIADESVAQCAVIGLPQYDPLMSSTNIPLKLLRKLTGSRRLTTGDKRLHNLGQTATYSPKGAYSFARRSFVPLCYCDAVANLVTCMIFGAWRAMSYSTKPPATARAYAGRSVFITIYRYTHQLIE